MQIIEPLEQSCYMLYLKLFFTPGHHTKLNKKARTEHLKANLYIGAYFMAYGVSKSFAPLYESSVVFLDSLLEKND